MEKVKRELKESFERHISEGLSPEEALAKAVSESKHRGEETFKDALRQLLKEIEESYSLKAIGEEDPLLALADSIYLEYELLLPKIKSLFKK